MNHANGIQSALQGVHAKWAGLDRNLKRLILLNFLGIASANTYVSVIVPWCRSIGFESAAVGGLNSIFQVVSAVMAVVGGMAADQFGRKNLFMVGQILRVAVATCLFVVRGYLGLVILFVMRGMVVVQRPSYWALLGGYTTRKNRATFMGISQAAGQTGQLVMPVVAGVLADHYGVKIPFMIALVFAIVGCIVTLALNGSRSKVRFPSSAADGRAKDMVSGLPKKSGESSRSTSQALASTLRRMFTGSRRTVVVLLLLASVLQGMSNGAVNLMLPFSIMDRFAGGYTGVSAAMTVSALGQIAVLLLGGRMADKYGRKNVIVFSGIGLTLMMGSIFLINAIWQLYAVLLLASMIGNISSPAIRAVYLEAVDERDRATFSGLEMGFVSAGLAIGSVLAGITYQVSFEWSWLGVFVITALEFLLLYIAVSCGKARKGALKPVS